MHTYEITLFNESNWGIKNNNEILILPTDTGLIEDNERVHFQSYLPKIQEDCLCVLYTSLNWKMKDYIEEVDPGVFKVTRKWINASSKTRKVQLLFEGRVNYDPTFYMIPCVSYNGNNEGKGKEPKGLTRDGKPWIFPYDRTGIPSATFSEDGKNSVGLFVFSDEEKNLKSSCAMEKVGNDFFHRLYWPNIESPVSYSKKDKYSSAIENFITVGPLEPVTMSFYITTSRVTIPNFGWTKAYDFVGHMLDEAESVDYKTVWDNSISFVKDWLYTEVEHKGLTNIGLLPEGKHNQKAGPNKRWKHRARGRYEIGWCGQNIALANALTYDAILNSSSDSALKGCSILRSWIQYPHAKNPLFLANKYNDRGRLEFWKRTVDTCNLGWGAWQMLEAYDSLKCTPGLIKDQHLLLDIPIRMCDFFEKLFHRKNKLFGKLWKTNGKCIDGKGSIGIFILLAMTKAYQITDKKSYLDCAINSYKKYCEQYLDKMICTAGALDTNCVDKETCWPFLKVGLDLYKITGDNYFLVQAEKAAYYLLTWMFHYNVPVSWNSDFEKYGYKTLGATSVSVQHHHLDPWGALICYDYKRLSDCLKNSLWRKRAEILWENATRCISDGSFEVHGMIRPRGSQNEAYFQSNWGFDSNWTDSVGTMNDWLVAWPCAFRLITMMRKD